MQASDISGLGDRIMDHATHHMFSPILAVFFGIITVLAVVLHLYNQMRKEKLMRFEKARLVAMFQMMERNMALDCGIMVWMSLHALGWLTHELTIVAGWSIVAVRLYITVRAYSRSKEVYGL